jgi:Tfp pilus assembly protein FimV
MTLLEAIEIHRAAMTDALAKLSAFQAADEKRLDKAAVPPPAVEVGQTPPVALTINGLTHDIPARPIVVGTPAEVDRYFNDELKNTTRSAAEIESRRQESHRQLEAARAAAPTPDAESQELAALKQVADAALDLADEHALTLLELIPETDAEAAALLEYVSENCGGLGGMFSEIEANASIMHNVAMFLRAKV